MADEPTPENVTVTETTETTVEATSPNPLDAVPPEMKAALRKANKEAETLRLKLKEIEDRDKSEAQKLAERAEAAEKERDALRSEALRGRVALLKGLPAELVDRLRGSTEEELTADADTLLALIPAPVSQPRGDIDQGPRGTQTLPVTDEMERHLRSLLGG